VKWKFVELQHFGGLGTKRFLGLLRGICISKLKVYNKMCEQHIVLSTLVVSAVIY
jgi:hypothetical protein